jgi:hypothetical protein
MHSIFARATKCALGLFLCAAVLGSFTGSTLLGQAGAKASCTVQAADYLGWKAEELANQWVKLEIVPQLGGRLMQVTFGGHDYLFVNQQLKGQVIPPETAGQHWNNYGGDKIWPMPEGEDDEQHWAGAGGEPLDNSPFSLQVLSQGEQCAVRLTGLVDPAIGQQYIREISITAGSPVISFRAVMKNVTGYPQTWSEQSVSEYNAAAPDDPNQFNPKFWGLTPANPASVFLRSYQVVSGMAQNRGYSVSGGLFRLHWGDLGGEVWVDSPAGWLAVVDGSTGYTMVERARYQPTAQYPGKATMLFFTTGTQPHSAPAPAPAGPPIYYMEAEVNSPMIELAPGESYAMDTQWYPTRMGEDFQTATYGGVVGQPLAVAGTPNGLVLTGAFGVFYAGKLVARYYSRGGAALGAATLDSVTPLQPIKLQTTVQAPAGTARVSLHLLDQQGLDRGPLGETLVNPPPPPDDRSQW